MEPIRSDKNTNSGGYVMIAAFIVIAAIVFFMGPRGDSEPPCDATRVEFGGCG